MATKTKAELTQEFISHLHNASQSYDSLTVMHDACRAMAIAIHQPLVTSKTEHDKYEAEYLSLIKKHSNASQEFSKALACVVFGLEFREDFLGEIMSRIGATCPCFGQFFTPNSVSRLMGDICATPPDTYKHGDIITMNDPACGASVLLIEGAESLMRNGVRQADIFISAEDLESLSFSVSYIQLSLLGYAARVTRMNTLSRSVIEGPWYTPGYFRFGMPMRLKHKAA